MTTNGSQVQKLDDAGSPKRQRPPAISQTDLETERAEGEGMGTARATSPKLDESGVVGKGPFVERVRIGVKQHPYVAMLAAAAVGVGVGLLMSSRVTRTIAMRAGALAITELVQKFVKEAIGASLTVQP